MCRCSASHRLMPTPFESADLILKLFELRREETMRKARDFMFGFDPKSFEEIQAVLMGPHSGHFRMVVSYWDMAASFVTNGAIDAKMFSDANAEHINAFGKVEPFLAPLRKLLNNQDFAKHLEQVCKEGPGGLERVAATRERMRQLLAARGAMAAQQS